MKRVRLKNPTVVHASAPARIDLAGGTLDIWPLSQIVPGALTINVAVRLRAHADVRSLDAPRVEILSDDRGARVTANLPLRDRDIRGVLSWPMRLVHAFAPGRGLRLTCRAEAPAGAGLGGSSTLGIAIAAALARATGRRMDRKELARRVMNLETRQLGVPTGDQDYLAAAFGGLNAWHSSTDGRLREEIEIPVGLEDRLVLAYTGAPRNSGFSNWDMFRRFVDGERDTVRLMRRIARIAGRMRDALIDQDLDRVGRLLGEEGRLRLGLAPSVSTPRIEEASVAAKRAGALGVKVCGAGGGGCLVAFTREGKAEEVGRAVERAGAHVLHTPISRSGLAVRASISEQ
jgi:D-glycero-alpha-D-manno-heptose-7-phosphate kinase